MWLKIITAITSLRVVHFALCRGSKELGLGVLGHKVHFDADTVTTALREAVIREKKIFCEITSENGDPPPSPFYEVPFFSFIFRAKKGDDFEVCLEGVDGCFKGVAGCLKGVWKNKIEV